MKRFMLWDNDFSGFSIRKTNLEGIQSLWFSKNLIPVSFLLLRALWDTPCLSAAIHPTPWVDTFYQYRIPITILATKPGWQVVPITELQITNAINALEELKYRDTSFAYNYIKCVEVDKRGNVIKPDVDAGFALIETGPDQVVGWMAERTPTNELVVPVAPDEFFLLRYTTSGGNSPAHSYEPIFPEGTKLNPHGYRISYEPRPLPLTETTHETLIQPRNDRMTLVVGGPYVNTPKALSLRQAKILFLVNIKTPGTKRLMLYYQPMGTHFLMVPERRHPQIPKARAALLLSGPAEKYEGRTRYALADNDKMAVWFAETTVKLTPMTRPPAGRQTVIQVACARNERLSFQIVLSPRRPFHFKGITATNLKGNDANIPAADIALKAVEYVPIRKASQITPTNYLGWIGDPLVELTPRFVTPEAGNFAVWATVTVGPDASAGTYRGTVRIETVEAPPLEVPIDLTVYDFALPEYSPLQMNLGGQFFAKTYPNNVPNIPYHGVKTSADLQKLARLHYEIMVRNKFTPKNAALYTPIGMEWDPPPDGYNVDKPGNYFRLHTWDFTAFNETLDYFINELKMNQICIYHTDPTALNVFLHLPGKERTDLSMAGDTPHVTYAWQTFREEAFVGYNIDEKHGYRKRARDISRAQYDRLVMDFFRAIAGNLDAHGWLNFATIMVDEQHNDQQLKHFLRLLKSDPLTARIKVGVCLQQSGYFADPEYHGLLDYYIPQLDENYNRWEPFYFTDYGIKVDRSKVWNYVVASARLAIDTPGINNRMVGLDLWKRGASGYLCWETFWYDHGRDAWGKSHHGMSGNPWLNPHTEFGNGALSFFYPPRRDGSYPEEPDFTVTPSLRMEAHRGAVNDYEYAWLLDKMATEAEQAGRDASEARAVLADIPRFFHNPNLWSQNDAWYLDLRDRIARSIVELKKTVKQ